MHSINLLINPYRSDNPQRQAELDYCRKRNAEIGIFDAIYVLNENDRAAYNDFFELTKQLRDDVNVIANLDIYFDETAATFAEMPERELWALTRWEAKTGRIHGDGNDRARFSQDVWAFRGACKVNAIWMGQPFGMGVPGCDNVLARLFRNAGYTVKNPCYDIRSWHLHANESRNYPRRIGNPSVFLPIDPSYLNGQPTKEAMPEVRHTFRKVIK
jgi:hypothetical protein